MAASRKRPSRRRKHLTAHQRRVRAGRKAARTRLRRYGSARRMRRAVGGDFGINPRKRYRRLSNPRGSSGMAGFGSVKGMTRLATGAGVGIIGAVGLDYLWQWGSPHLPVSLQTGYVGTVTKAGAAVLAGWLASKVVGRPIAVAGVLGALTVVGAQLVHQMIASHAPQASIPAAGTPQGPVAGLNAYMQPRLGWVSPGTPLALRGLRGMNAYMQQRSPMVNRPGGSVSPSGLAMAGGY